MDKNTYKKMIIEYIEDIENVNTLEYIYTFIKHFIEKWG